jgi:hypothetical protein
MSDPGRTWFEIYPHLGVQQTPFLKFCRKIQKQVLAGHVSLDAVKHLREQVSFRPGPQPIAEVKLRLVENVILDLVTQGWLLKIRGQTVKIHAPLQTSDSPQQEKDRVRRGHLLERESQLDKRPVADFIKGMETRRLTKHGWTSIFSVMRDGPKLTEELRKAINLTNEQERTKALTKVISPYIQFVEGETTCEYTGLKLRDIWRYFRLTWVNRYKSVPGRSIMVLIRDAAAPNHPIIGIAALGNSVVQQKARDEQIGWDAINFVRNLRDKPSLKLIRCLHRALDGMIGGVYIDDLLADSDLEFDLDLLSKPTHSIIERLRRESKAARDSHQTSPHVSIHKGNVPKKNEDGVDWRERAETTLFKSKRCLHLATLLSIRKIFQENCFTPSSRELSIKALESSHVRAAVGQLVRLLKAQRVGIDMLDIIVCGAIAPYNVLLGGKLVCMLLSSPEVVNHYRDKYKSRPSIIASSMKGSPVKRPHSLVLLCTTSLYSVGSSQYNRIKIPAEVLGGTTGNALEFRKLGYSAGFGSFHFSEQTLQWIKFTLGRKGNRKVNSIFGEGVNPLMRKIREALDYVGLPSEEILQHGNKRVIYIVPLAENYREVLIGLEKRPRYLVPQSDPNARTQSIASFWQKRWLASRILHLGILDRVKEHSVTYPVTHGARVRQSQHGLVKHMPDTASYGS